MPNFELITRFYKYQSYLSDPKNYLSFPDAVDVNKTKMICGLIGFDAKKHCKLFIPENFSINPRPIFKQNHSLPKLSNITAIPNNLNYSFQLATLIKQLTQLGLKKVVLARNFKLDFDSSPNTNNLIQNLAKQNPNSATFKQSFSPDEFFLGASPELVLATKSGYVHAMPLAGSALRYLDPDLDRQSAIMLQNSTKNLSEHRIVIDHYRNILTPFCDDLIVPHIPKLIATSNVWHLGTKITGKLKLSQNSSLNIIKHLHPTPAISGMPLHIAKNLINIKEPPRKYYGGLAGWDDGHGNSEWYLAIRCAEVNEQKNYVLAYAGGGIVADSDPISETNETIYKLKTITNALGVKIPNSLYLN